MSFKSIKSKILSEADQQFFFNLKADVVTKSFLMDTFANTAKGKAKYNSYDLLQISRSRLAQFQSPVSLMKGLDEKKIHEVTVGSFMAHLFLFDNPKIRENTKFYFGDWDKKVLSNINDDMVILLLEETIDADVYSDFTDRMQWMGLGITKFTAPSFDFGSHQPLPEVVKRREELFKIHAERIRKKDQFVMLEIQDELLALAKEILSKKEKPDGYELFESGVAAFGNHYRNVSVMRGNLPRSAKNSEFNLCKSTLSEGISKDEIHKFADLSVVASFSRAVGTQVGGYLVKQNMAAFQHLRLGPAGSDCKTRQYMDILLTKKNISDYHLRYILDGKKLVKITSQNQDKYIDTVVKMRTPLFCLDKDICSKCAGELYYRMGITNIGLLSGRIGSKVLNASLKFFHNVNTKVTDLEINESNCSPIDMEEVIPDNNNSKKK